jgi:hypothetical protein
LKSQKNYNAINNGIKLKNQCLSDDDDDLLPLWIKISDEQVFIQENQKKKNSGIEEDKST